MSTSAISIPLANRSIIPRRLSMKSSKTINEILDKADNEVIEDNDKIEKIRVKLKKFMSTSLVGLYYENILLIMSFISCMEYIYSTYLVESIPIQASILHILAIVELFVAVIFTLDWCLSFFLADHKIIFCTR